MGTWFYQNDTRKWLNRQLTRYRKDGFGYFAVILKQAGMLIGQVGLLKSEIEGKEVVELGYIFDNGYWHQGYCTRWQMSARDTFLPRRTLRCSIAASVPKTWRPYG